MEHGPRGSSPFGIAIAGALAAAALTTGIALIPSSSNATTAGTRPAQRATSADQADVPEGLPEGGLSKQALAMVRRYPQAVISARFYRGIETADVRSYDKVLAENWLDVPLLSGQGPGRAGFGSVIKTYHEAFPDLRVHIDEIVVAGNTVTSRNTLTGTQRGPVSRDPGNRPPGDLSYDRCSPFRRRVDTKQLSPRGSLRSL